MGDFKQNFDESLLRLRQINNSIDENIATKQAFSRGIISRLRDINQRIGELAGLIRGLKTRLEELETQVARNNTGIQERTAEIERLTALTQQLTGERDTIQTDMAQLRQQTDTERQDFQTRITGFEGEIRRLTDENAAIIAERDALREQIQSSGNQKDQQHAAAIQALQEQHAAAINDMRTEQQQQIDALRQETQQLGQQNQQELDTLRQQNQAALDALQQQHAQELDTLRQQHQGEITQRDTALVQQGLDYEEQIRVLRQQMEDAATAHGAQQLQNEDAMRELEGRRGELETRNEANTRRVAELERDLQALQTENQDLQQRIVAATQAIVEATGRLNELNNPDDYNQDELNQRFTEIEQSIQSISNAIQGHPGNPPSAGVRSASARQLRMPENTIIIVDGFQKPISQIVNDLKGKTRQDPRPDSKYAQALQQIYGADDADDILNILTHNNIQYNRSNGILRGGKTKKIRKNRKTKKIRKYKKQRGGFTYKPNAKRKRLTTSLFSKNRSSRTKSSNTSSRR